MINKHLVADERYKNTLEDFVPNEEILEPTARENANLKSDLKFARLLEEVKEKMKSEGELDL